MYGESETSEDDTSEHKECEDVIVHDITLFNKGWKLMLTRVVVHHACSIGIIQHTIP